MRVVTPSDTVLDQTAGDVEQLKRIATTLRQGRNDDTLKAISEHLRSICVPDKEAFWDSSLRDRRVSSDMLAPGSAWGCSAHAQVACHLARACGIPAILVKSLNVRWIDIDNSGDGRGHGHVWVEVLLHGKACLWDAQSGRLYEDYDPQSDRIEDKRIYETGGPNELVLSHHGSEWEAETRRLFPRRT